MTAPASPQSSRAFSLLAVGMATSLGPDCATSCASARAGITRVGDLVNAEFSGNAVYAAKPAKGHAVRLHSPGLCETARLRALGALALRDLLAQATVKPEETAFFLLLPDGFLLQALKPESATEAPRENWRKDCREIAGQLMQDVTLEIPPDRRITAFGGAAEAARILGEASEWMRAGKASSCIVGAVDSLLEPDLFEACATAGLWEGGNNALDWPGEGACFLLIETYRPSAALHEVSGITGVGWAPGAGHRWSGLPGTGGRMSAAASEAMGGSSAKGNSPGWILTNLCGDEPLTADFGKALVRLNCKHPLGDSPLRHPAEHFGDCGAAMGFICVGVYREALRRGYAPARHALVCLYSDNGGVGAIRLQSRGPAKKGEGQRL